MITQKSLLKQVKQLKNIKFILGRKRLRFSYQEIAYYLYMLVLHQDRQIEFKQLYHEYKDSHSYSNFMKSIQLCSKLLKSIFILNNKTINIKPSGLINIVDSTLIPTLQSKSIKQKHWDRALVTTRQENKTKVHIAGLKAMVFSNRQGKVYRVDILPINCSDLIVTKNPLFYSLKGILLADRGFNSKEIRKRSIGFYRLISPYRKSEKKILSEQELRLYKLRWNAETIFKQVKDKYKQFKLNISNKYSKPIQEGEVYLAFIKYNNQLLNNNLLI